MARFDRSHFDSVANALCLASDGIDRVTLYYAAEDSCFVRFNHAQVRQATEVLQIEATLTLVSGARQAAATVTLSGKVDGDIERLLTARAALQADLPQVPPDPHLLLPDTVVSSAHEADGAMPSAPQVISAVAHAADGADFVGLYAGGPMARGFADSRGQRNWHAVESFVFDWSVYHAGDQAVKTSYAGTAWDGTEFARRVAQARQDAALFEKPRKTLAPGTYRAALSHAAVADLLGLLERGGFSARGVRTGTSPLSRLHQGQAQFHPDLHLTEDTAAGLAPAFQADGFAKPARVPLVRAGKAADLLACARSAREYGLPANGAAAYEAPDSLDIAAGTLPERELLARLGTGVYLSDVHYLNYSDRLATRVTGMTRFASCWVENGVPVAPLSVMRFDDTLTHLFGEGLIGLTAERELFPETQAYGSRQLRSVRAPAGLVEGLRFTL